MWYSLNFSKYLTPANTFTSFTGPHIHTDKSYKNCKLDFQKNSLPHATGNQHFWYFNRQFRKNKKLWSSGYILNNADILGRSYQSLSASRYIHKLMEKSKGSCFWYQKQEPYHSSQTRIRVTVNSFSFFHYREFAIRPDIHSQSSLTASISGRFL